MNKIVEIPLYLAWSNSINGEEVFILNISNDEYTTIDGIGPEVWDLLIAGYTFDEICHEIAKRYDVDVKTVQRDVSCLFEYLIKKAIIINTEERRTQHENKKICCSESY